jgi:multiple antibiotic resistance protein
LIEIAFTGFITFLVILDPPGTAVLFIALTRDLPAAKRRATAWAASLLAGGILLLFAFTGKMWLAALGISLPAFRIAGGLLLFMLATQMVFGRQSAQDTETPTQDDITVFPLAFPLIAGPGAMTSVILLMGKATGDMAQGAVVIAMLLTALGVVLGAMLQAERIVRVLKISGCHVVARVMAINLAALAVQFIVDGAHDILAHW